MKINKLLFLAFCGAAFLTSCSSDDDGGGSEPVGQYDDGLFVLNEGDGVSGSVTFLSSDLATQENDVFGTVNAGSGQSIGGYVQSIFFDGDNAYIFSTGSNKITVVNRYTFEYIATVSTGLAVPRYGVAYNGKAYVTNLNSFATNADDYVAVIDLATLNVEAPIAVNDYADHIVAHEGKLYVANGSFGMGTNVTVIDTATNAITEVLNMEQSPNSLEVSGDIVYVLCGSMTGDSKMVRIATVDDTDTDDINEEDTIESAVTFDTVLDNAQNLDIENNRAYFTVGAKIYRVALNAVAVNDTPIIDTESTSLYIGYGFAVKNSRIYIAEGAEDFVSNGKVYIYSTSGGDAIATKTVGLGPNGFFFNY
jgi:hypothetical protein